MAQHAFNREVLIYNTSLARVDGKQNVRVCTCGEMFVLFKQHERSAAGLLYYNVSHISEPPQNGMCKCVLRNEAWVSLRFLCYMLGFLE